MKQNRIIEINNILNFLSMAWEKNPDLRLMQLLGNGFPAGDCYYVKDEEVAEYLIKIIKEIER